MGWNLDEKRWYAFPTFKNIILAFYKVMEIIKIGNITRKLNIISLVIIDSSTKYYENLKSNKDFFSKYQTMKSKNIINMEVFNVKEDIKINNILTLESFIGKAKIIGYEEILDIVDNLIITEHYLYMIIDKVYLREKAFNKLGI